MDRRDFFKLAAGFTTAAAVVGIPKIAAPIQEDINTRYPLHVCFADGSIHRLVRVKGTPQPGELLYWDMSSGRKDTVCAISFRDLNDKGWRS
jgi:hypothetical protein